MRTPRIRHLLFVAALAVLAPAPAPATDVDPPDCQVVRYDYGDAPEGMPAYPSGVMGHFPTCIVATPPGTQELSCPPISTAPGATGYVLHVQPGNPGNYWLGCYASALGPEGLDTDPDGKVGLPGYPSCAPGDCVEPAWGLMPFDQDECYADGSDAGVTAPPSFLMCMPATVSYDAFNCAQQRQVLLNICVDWNGDGDWNDDFPCPNIPGSPCAYEWAVKNAPILLVPGCNSLVSPPFAAGPFPRQAWMRVSLTDLPVPDDYPWAGSAGMAGGAFEGGETEDYPVTVEHETPARQRTWGSIKQLYR